MHKERSFCYFGDEQLRLKEPPLESLGKEKFVWESLRTVDSISPLFKGKAPALSVELLFNADKTLKEVRIVDRVKSITARYDGSGKLVMDDWFLKHPECTETAKGYGQRLNALLTYTCSIQKPTIAGSPKQVFQPHVIKTETAIPAPQQEVKKGAFRYLPGVMGRRPFTPEQMKIRNAEIDAFCKEKGIDADKHPYIHRLALKNLKKIVVICEEKHIPYTPYRTFLSYSFSSFNSNLKALEEHGIDPVKFSYALVYPTQNLSDNLKTCAEERRDAVEEALVPHLSINPEKFREFLKTYVPFEHLSPEEREKKVIAIFMKNGLEEKDIKEYAKKKAPETIERIIGICDKHNFDWRTHQIVFSYAPGTLNSNLDACTSGNIDPVKFELLADLTLPNEKFNARLREIIEKGIQPRVLSAEERRSRVLEIMAKEGLGENEINDHVKRRGLHPFTVERIIGICNKHNLDWKNHQTIFACGPNTLESNLNLCEFNNVDPVKFGITSRLNLPRDDFKEYLKVLMAQKGLEFRESPKEAFQPHVIKTETPTPVPREALITRTRNPNPRRSIAEELIEARESVGERNRKIAELFAANGADIKSFPIYVWLCSPSQVEKIMHSCDQHNFDWRLHSEVFRFKYENLDPNLALCNYNDADPVKLRFVGKLRLPHEQFKNFLRDLMTAKGLEFKEPEIQKDI